MTMTFDSLSIGDTIDGPAFPVSRESIRLFCDGSLDYNPLHLDDDYMKNNFGKTNFGGIIMHGMNNFGLITRMITDWAYPAGAHPLPPRNPAGSGSVSVEIQNENGAMILPIMAPFSFGLSFKLPCRDLARKP